METFKCSKQLCIFILALVWFIPTGESHPVVESPREKYGEKPPRKIGTGQVLGGLGTYAAYRSWDRNNKGPNPSKNKDTDSSESEAYSENFLVLESTYSRRREGSGMSAWSLLMIILGIIGGCTILWYCYAIGVPLWRDRQASRRRSYQLSSVNVKGSGDDMPLHETPSTATPSP